MAKKISLGLEIFYERKTKQLIFHDNFLYDFINNRNKAPIIIIIIIIIILWSYELTTLFKKTKVMNWPTSYFSQVSFPKPEQAKETKRTWQINREMPILHDQFKMIKHREYHRRHRKKWGHWNILSVPHGDRPVYMSISHDGFHRWLKPVQELLKWRFHLGIDGFHEASKIFPTTLLGRYAVGYGGEAYISWLWVWADESEPLFGDDEADENIGAFWSQ